MAFNAALNISYKKHQTLYHRLQKVYFYLS